VRLAPLHRTADSRLQRPEPRNGTHSPSGTGSSVLSIQLLGHQLISISIYLYLSLRSSSPFSLYISLFSTLISGLLAGQVLAQPPATLPASSKAPDPPWPACWRAAASCSSRASVAGPVRTSPGRHAAAAREPRPKAPRSARAGQLDLHPSRWPTAAVRVAKPSHQLRDAASPSPQPCATLPQPSPQGARQSSQAIQSCRSHQRRPQPRRPQAGQGPISRQGEVPQARSRTGAAAIKNRLLPAPRALPSAQPCSTPWAQPNAPAPTRRAHQGWPPPRPQRQPGARHTGRLSGKEFPHPNRVVAATTAQRWLAATDRPPHQGRRPDVRRRVLPAPALRNPGSDCPQSGTNASPEAGCQPQRGQAQSSEGSASGRNGVWNHPSRLPVIAHGWCRNR